MKTLNKNNKSDDEMLPEYDLDYSKSRPNKFAKPNSVLMPIDEEVAKVFETSENINNVLKAIIKSVKVNNVAAL